MSKTYLFTNSVTFEEVEINCPIQIRRTKKDPCQDTIKDLITSLTGSKTETKKKLY